MARYAVPPRDGADAADTPRYLDGVRRWHDALARAWAQETANTPLRVNLFNPGPVRTRMRATLMPGEDPATLDTAEQVADFIVPMCAPDWTETGKFYDYKTRSLMSFRSPA